MTELVNWPYDLIDFNSQMCKTLIRLTQKENPEKFDLKIRFKTFDPFARLVEFVVLIFLYIAVQLQLSFP